MVDLVNRDPNDVHEHLKIQFEDVLAEPEGSHSRDCVWAHSGRVFLFTKDCCYKLLTLLCGLPLAVVWGCQFACITFHHVWQLAPCLKALSIYCSCVNKVIVSCLQSCLDPVCESCGLLFSKIVLKRS